MIFQFDLFSRKGESFILALFVFQSFTTEYPLTQELRILRVNMV